MADWLASPVAELRVGANGAASGGPKCNEPLAPDIVEAIIKGEEPDEVSYGKLACQP